MVVNLAKGRSQKKTNKSKEKNILSVIKSAVLGVAKGSSSKKKKSKSSKKSPSKSKSKKKPVEGPLHSHKDISYNGNIYWENPGKSIYSPKKPPSKKNSSSSKKPVSKKSPSKSLPKKSKKTKKEISKKTVNKKSSKSENKKKRSSKKYELDSIRYKVKSVLSDSLVRQKLIDTGGEYAIEVIRSVPMGVSDETLAKKLSARISDIRATLNKLHEQGIMFYKRDKDEKKGWFTYRWSINVDEMLSWSRSILEKEAVSFDPSKELYFCSKCGPSSVCEFSDAMDLNFKCVVCNSLLEYLDKDTFSNLVKNDKTPINRLRL